MKRMLLISILFTALTTLIYAQQWSAKDFDGLEIYPVRNESNYFKRIKANLGELYVAFKYNGVTFRDDSGRYVNAFDFAYVFAVRKGITSVLCKIEKYRILDALGIVLFDVARDDPQLYPMVVGISSILIEDPTHVALVAKFRGQNVNGEYYETEELMALGIDVTKKTIVKLNI